MLCAGVQSINKRCKALGQLLSVGCDTCADVPCAVKCMQAPRKLSTKVPDRMGYEDFVWFMLSEEDKSTDVSLEYWFRCIDLDFDGVLRSNELLVSICPFLLGPLLSGALGICYTACFACCAVCFF